MLKKNINIREIAKLAGVSATAVSYALKGDPLSKLSQEKRRHILEVCAEYHYHPNENTRRMFSRKANTAAIFFPPGIGNTGMSYVDQNFSCCLIGAQSELAARGMDLLLIETNADFIREKRYLRLIRGGLLDGILLWGTLAEDTYLDDVLKEKLPLVMLQADLGKTPTVTSDDYGGAGKLAEEALRLGHRKIAVVPAVLTSLFGQRFLAGVCDALKAAGITPFLTSVSGFDDRIAQSAVSEILERAPETTCIMTASDVAAWGCIRELSRRGRKVPDTMSVTGAGGFYLGSLLQVDSFRIPSYRIGREGSRLLCELIEEKGTPESILLPADRVPGDTLRKPAESWQYKS